MFFFSPHFIVTVWLREIKQVFQETLQAVDMFFWFRPLRSNYSTVKVPVFVAPCQHPWGCWRKNPSKSNPGFQFRENVWTEDIYVMFRSERAVSWSFSFKGKQRCDLSVWVEYIYLNASTFFFTFSKEGFSAPYNELKCSENINLSPSFHAFWRNVEKDRQKSCKAKTNLSWDSEKFCYETTATPTPTSCLTLNVPSLMSAGK